MYSVNTKYRQSEYLATWPLLGFMDTFSVSYQKLRLKSFINLWTNHNLSMEFSLLKRNSPLTPSLLRLPSGMAIAKFFKVSPHSHTGIFDSEEIQSNDPPFSLPVRLKYGKCQVFSLCKSIFPHWDLWFRRETVIRLALFPACPKAEPWQLQSFLCRCKPTYAHWNLCSLNLRIAIAIIRPWKKFQSDFKYGEPFRHQMGA